jgi:hypothetical protein
MNIPGDWSWANLKDKLGGIMDDPTQLNQSPLFNVGMGLLASRYDGNINPAGAAMQGLQTAQGSQQALEDRERLEKLRAEMSRLIGGSPSPGSPSTPPPFMPTSPPPEGYYLDQAPQASARGGLIDKLTRNYMMRSAIGG